MPAAGKYWGEFQSIDITKAKTGSPQVEIVFKITHKPDADGKWQNCPEIGMRTIYQSLHGGAWDITIEQLGRLGFNGDFSSPVLDPAIVGNGVELDCYFTDYDGKPQEKWRLGGGRKKGDPVENETARRLNAMWKNANGATPKPAGKPPAPSVQQAEPQAVGTPAVDDDIPF